MSLYRGEQIATLFEESRLGDLMKFNSSVHNNIFYRSAIIINLGNLWPKTRHFSTCPHHDKFTTQTFAFFL